MSKKHESRHLHKHLKIFITAVTVLLLLFVALYVSCVVLIRGSDASFREKLCGTFVEKGYFFTDWFFTTNEIKASSCSDIPRESTAVNGGKLSAGLLSSFTLDEDENGNARILSGNWTATVYEIDPATMSLAKAQVSATDKYLCIGIVEYPEMALLDECLSYTGDGGSREYGFIGIESSGVLHIGAKTATEAANSGYPYGISCERILVCGGAPCSGLAGGYNSRVAIGQRADGSVFVMVVKAGDGMFNYPCGISYDTLAYLMYAKGAQNAAVLPASGEISVNNVNKNIYSGKTGYVFRAGLCG